MNARIPVEEMNFLSTQFEANDTPHWRQVTNCTQAKAKLIYVCRGDNQDPEGEDSFETCPIKLITVEVPKNIAAYRVYQLVRHCTRELSKIYGEATFVGTQLMRKGSSIWNFEGRLPVHPIQFQ